MPLCSRPRRQGIARGQDMQSRTDVTDGRGNLTRYALTDGLATPIDAPRSAQTDLQFNIGSPNVHFRTAISGHEALNGNQRLREIDDR